MSDHLSLSGSDLLAHDRAGDLRSTAHETHGAPKAHGTPGHPGVVQRVRATLGRRLVSIGSAVAGHHD
jgi:hypothetical protein